MKSACVIRRARFVVLVGVFIACVRMACLAQETPFDHRDAFARANGYYRANNYDSALAEYGGIVARGYESGNIYFNMGNCYFKKGDLGNAALYYARARVLIPGDRDLEANYSYLASQLDIDPEAQGFAGGRFARLLDRMFEAVSIDALAAWLAYGYAGACLFLILSLYIGSLKKIRVFVVCLAVIACAVAAAGLKRKLDYRSRCAIVVAQKSEAKFEPLDSATTYFTLGMGSAVEVVESSGNWSKIRRSDGKAGWVHKDGLARVTGG